MRISPPARRDRDGLGVSFALLSVSATRVELFGFDLAVQTELDRFDLPKRSNGVWHGDLPVARPSTTYADCVNGPRAPQESFRLNPNEPLIDPHPQRFVGALDRHDAIFGYRAGDPDADLSFDEPGSTLVASPSPASRSRTGTTARTAIHQACQAP